MDVINLTSDYEIKSPWDLQRTVTSCDITLGQLFDIVAKFQEDHPDFAYYCGMKRFWAFYLETQIEPENKRDDLFYLELAWSFDYDLRVINGKEKQKKLIGKHEHDPARGEIWNLMSFDGVGKCTWETDWAGECPCEKDSTYKHCYAVEFTPVSEICHLPLKIEPTVEIWQPKNESLVKPGFTITIDPNLWTVITSVFFELTFAGTEPIERDDKREDLHDRIDEMKQQLKDGTLKTRPVKDFFKEIEESSEDEEDDD